MKRYEKLIRSVCRIDWHYDGLPEHEREGAIGVACIAAYLNGVKANVDDLSGHLELDKAEVEVPFRRLLTNGAFSKNDVRHDAAFTDNSVAPETRRTAWCYAAGLASGLAGLREELTKSH